MNHSVIECKFTPEPMSKAIAISAICSKCSKRLWIYKIERSNSVMFEFPNDFDYQLEVEPHCCVCPSK